MCWLLAFKNLDFLKSTAYPPLIEIGTDIVVRFRPEGEKTQAWGLI